MPRRRRPDRGEPAELPFVAALLLPAACVVGALVFGMRKLVAALPQARYTIDGAQDAMEAWVTAHGGSVRGVHFVQTGTERGRVAKAARRIEAGEVLLRIPLALVLTSTAARHGAVGGSLRGRLASVSPAQLLALQLLWERRRGARSDWQPWVATLPLRPSTALLLSREDRRCLDPSTRRAAEAAAGEAAALLSLARELAAAEPGDFLWPVDEGEAQWAMATVWSRATPLTHDGELALVPGLDLFNHAPTAAGGVTHAYQPSPRPQHAAVWVQAHAHIPYGHEICADYHSVAHIVDAAGWEEPFPTEVFLRYGFTPQDPARVPVGWAPAAALRIVQAECGSGQAARRHGHLTLPGADWAPPGRPGGARPGMALLRNGSVEPMLLRCVAADAAAGGGAEWGAAAAALGVPPAELPAMLLNRSVPVEQPPAAAPARAAMRRVLLGRLAAVPAPAAPQCAQAGREVLLLNGALRETLFDAYWHYGGTPEDFAAMG